MKGNFNTLINDDRPVMVDFHALWCAPCKVQSPVLKEVAAELGSRIKIIKIDVDQNPEIANRYNIQGVPTLMIFKNGEEVDKMVGFQPKQHLKSKLEQYAK